MRPFIKYFLIILLTFASTNLRAEDKIVILDLRYVLNESKAGKGAQDFLKDTFNKNQKKFTDMEKKLKKEESDLLSKKTILSKEEYSKKSDELRKKVIDYQSERRQALEKIAALRTKSRETLIKKIDPILNSYIKENNISLVIDKKDVLGGQPENDITKIIIEKLNKELPSLNLK